MSDEKPNSLRKGMTVDFLYLTPDEPELNAQAVKHALKTIEEGGSVLLGTPDLLDRFLFPGATVINKYKVADDE